MTTLVPEMELKECSVEQWQSNYKMTPNKLNKSYNIFDLIGRGQESYTIDSSDSDGELVIIPKGHGLLVEKSGLASWEALNKVCIYI